MATSILALEGDGKVTRWPGNFSTYRTLKEQGEAAKPAASVAAPPIVAKPVAAPAPKAAKLSFKEQRELEGMEAAIEAAESEQGRGGAGAGGS